MSACLKFDERRVEAKKKFYTSCKSLAGEEKWNEEKQAIYEKLINEKSDVTLFHSCVLQFYN